MLLSQDLFDHVRVLAVNVVATHFDKFELILSEHSLDVDESVGAYFAEGCEFMFLDFHGVGTFDFGYLVGTLHFWIAVGLPKLSFKKQG